MGAGGFEDEAELITKAENKSELVLKASGSGDIRARAKEEDHAEQFVSIAVIGGRIPAEVLHKGMRKADFSPVDSTIAGCFRKSEVVGVLRIKDDPVHSLLLTVRIS